METNNILLLLVLGIMFYLAWQRHSSKKAVRAGLITLREETKPDMILNSILGKVDNDPKKKDKLKVLDISFIDFDTTEVIMKAEGVDVIYTRKRDVDDITETVVLTGLFCDEPLLLTYSKGEQCLIDNETDEVIIVLDHKLTKYEQIIKCISAKAGVWLATEIEP